MLQPSSGLYFAFMKEMVISLSFNDRKKYGCFNWVGLGVDFDALEPHLQCK